MANKKENRIIVQNIPSETWMDLCDEQKEMQGSSKRVRSMNEVAQSLIRKGRSFTYLEKMDKALTLQDALIQLKINEGRR